MRNVVNTVPSSNIEKFFKISRTKILDLRSKTLGEICILYVIRFFINRKFLFYPEIFPSNFSSISISFYGF